MKEKIFVNYFDDIEIISTYKRNNADYARAFKGKFRNKKIFRSVKPPNIQYISLLGYISIN